MTPSPAVRHQVVVTLFWRRLDAVARTAGGLAIVAPLDVQLVDGRTVQPDLLYLSPARLPLARERLEGAPDLVVEVLSPTSSRRDRGEKLRAYLELGVGEYWIVDATACRIELLHNRGGRFERAEAPEGQYRSEALPGLVLDLEGFWAEVDARLAP
jgi:Uma2 family endonuclease